MHRERPLTLPSPQHRKTSGQEGERIHNRPVANRPQEPGLSAFVVSHAVCGVASGLCSRMGPAHGTPLKPLRALLQTDPTG